MLLRLATGRLRVRPSRRAHLGWSPAAVACAVAWTLALASPGSARATPPDPPPAAAPPAPGWFLMPGLSLGAAATAAPTAPTRWAFTLGAEVSAVYLWGTTWAGIYADGAWATPGDGGRLSAGAEVGWALWGLELGWAAKLSPRALGEPIRHGLRVGLLTTVGAVGSYVRWLHLPGVEATGGLSASAHGAEDIVTLGLLFKWPLGLSEQR